MPSIVQNGKAGSNSTSENLPHGHLKTRQSASQPESNSDKGSHATGHTGNSGAGMFRQQVGYQAAVLVCQLLMRCVPPLVECCPSSARKGWQRRTLAIETSMLSLIVCFLLLLRARLQLDDMIKELGGSSNELCVQKAIGRGAQGVVYRGTWRGQEVSALPLDPGHHAACNAATMI